MQHAPGPPTHIWPEATTEAAAYIRKRPPTGPLKDTTPYDQRFGQAPNSAPHRTISCATYHQATPYDQWFGQTPNIPYTRTIGYAAHHRTTPYGLWFSHTPNIVRTRTFDRVDHCQATPNETDEKTSPPDRRESSTDCNPVPCIYIGWDKALKKNITTHNDIFEENRTYRELDNTDTATERQELIISDTTAKCPASRTASDDHPSGTHTSNAHPNDERPNSDRPSDEHSSDDPTYEQIKGRTDVQQRHDATSTESCDIPKNKHISMRNIGFNENKTCRDYKHADTNAERQELITIDETAKRTISRATDDAHPTSDSTYEDALEVPPHIATRDIILDENKTYREPGNIDTAIEGQELVISYTIAKCPASHTASDAHPSDAHQSDVHPSDDPTHEQTKGRLDKRQSHDAANAKTRDVPKKGNVVADKVSRANAQAHIPDYKNFKAGNELWVNQAALASTEDEHLNDITNDRTSTTDANQNDYHSKLTHYLRNERHRPESSPEQRWHTHDTPLKPSDSVSSRDNYTLTRRRSMLIPKQTEPHKIAEQVTDDAYRLAKLSRATSMRQCLEIASKRFFMEYPKEPISKDP
ncbi:hypothetical protein EV182_002541, partial [Spiromyces aspiralis]